MGRIVLPTVAMEFFRCAEADKQETIATSTAGASLSQMPIDGDLLRIAMRI